MRFRQKEFDTAVEALKALGNTATDDQGNKIKETPHDWPRLVLTALAFFAADGYVGVVPPILVGNTEIISGVFGFGGGDA